MINEILEKAIKKEVENRVKDFKLNYENNSKKILEQEKIINNLSEENKLLKIDNNRNKNRNDLLDFIQSVYNKNNLNELIQLFGYEKIESVGIGMDVDDIDPIFKLIFEYYNNKLDILNICDILNIEYPKWYINYKMPYDYDLKTVKLFLKKLNKAYICNRCIYENNIGFFYNNIKHYNDENELINKEMYHDIPWQLFLKNKLLLTDSIWEIITNKIKNNCEHSYYLFRIDIYQDLNSEQEKQMFNLAIKSKHSEAKYFIRRHMNLLKLHEDIAENFKDKISFENYIGVHFSMFPKNIQIEYLKTLSIENLNKALEDNKCELTNEEKRNLMIELVNNKWK